MRGTKAAYGYNWDESRLHENGMLADNNARGKEEQHRKKAKQTAVGTNIFEGHLPLLPFPSFHPPRDFVRTIKITKNRGNTNIPSSVLYSPPLRSLRLSISPLAHDECPAPNRAEGIRRRHPPLADKVLLAYNVAEDEDRVGLRASL